MCTFWILEPQLKLLTSLVCEGTELKRLLRSQQQSELTIKRWVQSIEMMQSLRPVMRAGSRIAGSWKLAYISHKGFCWTLSSYIVNPVAHLRTFQSFLLQPQSISSAKQALGDTGHLGKGLSKLHWRHTYQTNFRLRTTRGKPENASDVPDPKDAEKRCFSVQLAPASQQFVWNAFHSGTPRDKWPFSIVYRLKKAVCFMFIMFVFDDRE